MLKRILTRPDPQSNEAADYIRDTLMVLSRLADDIKSPALAGRLRTAFHEPSVPGATELERAIRSRQALRLACGARAPGPRT
jgi:hypothetical protein